MSQTKDFKNILADAGISILEREEARSGGSAFVAYMVDDHWIHVEFMAPNMAESILRLPVNTQSKLFSLLVQFVPNVGDQFRLTNTEGDDRKERGARIIRVAPDNPKDVSLFVTR
jgi:hypothetical protein